MAVPETVAWSANSGGVVPENGASTVTLSWIRFRLGFRRSRRFTAHAESAFDRSSRARRIAALPNGSETPKAIDADPWQLSLNPRGTRTSSIPALMLMGPWSRPVMNGEAGAVVAGQLVGSLWQPAVSV